MNVSQARFISEAFIKPKYEVDEACKQPYHLSPIDLFMLSLDHMQVGLLFSAKPEFVESFVEKLKQSLAISLVHFYPLAGRLATTKYPDEHACWIFVDCNKGPGARIVHATVDDVTVSDILSYTDVHPVVRSFFDLGEKAVNHDGHTKPLLSIQVTELPDGIFIAFTMNHSICDGISRWNFISSLSEVFAQLESGNDNELISISQKPTYKPFFPKGYGPVLKLPYLEPEEFISRFDPGRLRERIFNFSPGSIAELKAKANEQSRGNNISSFQALCGLVWKCITRARNLPLELETHFTIIVSMRSRVNPPLSQDYFGNFITPAATFCKVGEILGQDLGWVSSLLHQCVMSQDEKAVLDFLNYYVKAPYVGQTGSDTAYYKPNSLLIAGSSRFNAYGHTFGIGQPVAVLGGYANKDDGKITANPGREGGGSVDLEICLKPEVMDALELDEEFMNFVTPKKG